MTNIINPKRPSGPGWQQVPVPTRLRAEGYPCECWLHPDHMFNVISAVEVAKEEGGIDKGPEYHVSISRANPSGPSRCTSSDALWVLAQFDMADSEEDNHVPNGVVRNFWRPVAENLVGIECACKDDEPEIREDKGDFVWRGITE